METQPSHLSVFVVETANGRAIARLPVYAEVGVTRAVVPGQGDPRFAEAVQSGLRTADQACFAEGACRTRVVQALPDALGRLLTEDARDHLLGDPAGLDDLMAEILRSATDSAQVPSLDDLPEDRLAAELAAAVRRFANEHGLELVEEPATTTRWAYPLGMVATDHVGYLSFDLTRLPADIHRQVRTAIEQRRDDPSRALDVSVWLYPLALDPVRFDALAQGRFAEEAIVVKLALPPPDMPEALRNMGLLAMQRPSLVDWRLSPASFASNPALLTGDEDCEGLLPSHVALREFHFYQVVRLTDGAALIPAGLRERVRLGFVNEYSTAWQPLGHSLGQILYSLPLAPGESVNLAVIDWTRRDRTQRTEDTKVTEQLVHNEHRERAITETVEAALREWQHGSSFMGGAAYSAGLSAVYSGVGIAAGFAGSLGGSTATSEGTRNLTANTVQKVSDNITQASSAARELQSTVVVQSTQEEHEAIQTRTVVNYNHSHALTVLYYEVLRHFRVVTSLVRRRPALLVRHALEKFSLEYDVPLPTGSVHVRTYSPFLWAHRHLLRTALLDPAYQAAFDALERVGARGRSAPPPAPTPENQGEIAFVYFEISFQTGGFVNHQTDVKAQVFDTTPKKLVDLKRANDRAPSINYYGVFGQENAWFTLWCVVDAPAPPKWKDIGAINVVFDPANKQALGIKEIVVRGSDMHGHRIELLHWTREIIVSEATGVVLEVNRPPVAPAPPGPSAEQLADEGLLSDLLDHLDRNEGHYNRVVWFGEDARARATRLDAVAWGGGSTLLDHVENRPLEIFGEWVAFPTADPPLDDAIRALDRPGRAALAPAPLDERLVTLPTRGVFAEAKLGHCNASEEIDNRRFWDWQQSPIPHLAPEIAPIVGVTPQPQQQDAHPSAFPTSLVNIVNPPAAPDPTGLASALGVLATPNIFRDMSGRAEVADLLKKLSDNTIGIAQAAGQARQIQQKYGSAGAAAAAGGAPGAGLGAAKGVGGPRALPTQPSATNRDLYDFQDLLGRSVDKGLMTPGAAREAFKDAVQDAYPGLQLGFKVPGESATGSAFPSPYEDPFAPPGNNPLQQALEDARNAMPAADRAMLEKLSITIGELSFSRPLHVAAHNRGDEFHFSGSLLKVAAVYAGFELRAAARRFAEENAITSAGGFFDRLRAEFNPQIKASLPFPLVKNEKIRKFNDTRIPEKDITLPAYDTLLAVTTGLGGDLVVDFHPTFLADMGRIFSNQNDHEPPQNVVHALGYGYINCALAAAGFGPGDPPTGIWLAGDFSNQAIWPSAKIPCLNDGETAQGMTTNDMARLLSLLYDKRLFVDSGFISSSGAMLKLMSHGTSWLAQFWPRPESGGTPGPVWVTHAKVGTAQLADNLTTVTSEGAIVHEDAHQADFVVVWQNLHAQGVASALKPIATLVEKTITSYLASL